jgi:hypothetical protein
VVPAGAVLVMGSVRLSHTPWHKIGYVRPPKAQHIAVVIACKAARLLRQLLKGGKRVKDRRHGNATAYRPAVR